MIIDTKHNQKLDGMLLNNYLCNLVNRIFKILPIRENEEPTLPTYIDGLLTELVGCKELLPALREDAIFLSILAVLQFLSSNPSSPIRVFRREVFGLISACNKLKSKYVTSDEG